MVPYQGRLERDKLHPSKKYHHQEQSHHLKHPILLPARLHPHLAYCNYDPRLLELLRISPKHLPTRLASPKIMEGDKHKNINMEIWITNLNFININLLKLLFHLFDACLHPSDHNLCVLGRLQCHCCLLHVKRLRPKPIRLLVKPGIKLLITH